MSGCTGKMTREAIKVRGPRLVLYKVFNPKRDASMLLISRFGQSPFTERKVSILQCNIFIVARSYSLSYLRKVAAANG